MMDSDLAALFQTKTNLLNRSVKRNSDFFSKDVMFQLTLAELDFISLHSRIPQTNAPGGRRSLPHCFTEMGVTLLSSVLKTVLAAKINISIMQAFKKNTETRDSLDATIESLKDIGKQLNRIEAKLDLLQNFISTK